MYASRCLNVLIGNTFLAIKTSISINSLAPGSFEWNFTRIIFKLISVISGWGISCEIALRWMPLALTDYKSTLVQVMAWCRQATSYYLNQCWARSPTPGPNELNVRRIRLYNPKRYFVTITQQGNNEPFVMAHNQTNINQNQNGIVPILGDRNRAVNSISQC